MKSNQRNQPDLKIDLIEEAKKFIQSEYADPASVQELAKELSSHFEQHTFARRLLTILYGKEQLDTKGVFDFITSIYKDDELPSDERFALAERILLSMSNNKHDEIKEMKPLGLLGAIYKRKWKFDNQPESLYHSLEFYERGHQIFMEKVAANDKKSFGLMGYCGVNAAFIYDLLADWNERIKKANNASTEVIAKHFRKKATRIRKDLIKVYEDYETSDINPALQQYLNEPDDKTKDKLKGWYWTYATWGEALVGLKKFEEATEKFRIAVNEISQAVDKVHAWQREITARQIIETINSLMKNRPNNIKKEAWQLKLREYLRCVEPLRGKFSDDIVVGKKVGLALSGGGFRAALFHIGVLAQLAEQDRLRDIEVISCVSGGSIIGAYYYLKVKDLLDSLPDAEITNEHYKKIISEIKNDFTAAVSQNLRMMIYGNTWQLLKFICTLGTWRSKTVANLYDKLLYPPWKSDKAITMDELRINPKGDSSFEIKRDNWKRRNKVPMLVINATNLNTGHNWQFTASWMGESPNYINNEFDARPTLRRMYYSEAPGKHKKIRLSVAVGASSCVPTLFRPVVLKNLYEKDKQKITVKLVDGGVHDNQGIYTLLEQECNSLILSDAAGQLGEIYNHSSLEHKVLFRTNDILMERVRDLQFSDLKSRVESGLIKEFYLMHLTKDLKSEVLNWTDCRDKFVHPDPAQQNPTETDETNYFIRRKLQEKIARIRTDLDSFNESETLALMYSGFMMTQAELSKHDLPKAPNTEEKIAEAKQGQKTFDETWNWSSIREKLDDPQSDKKIGRLLEVSQEIPLKWLNISPVVKYVVLGALLIWSLNNWLIPCWDFACLYCPLAIRWCWEKIQAIQFLPHWLMLHKVYLLLFLLVPYLFFRLLNVWYLTVGSVHRNWWSPIGTFFKTAFNQILWKKPARTVYPSKPAQPVDTENHNKPQAEIISEDSVTNSDNQR